MAKQEGVTVQKDGSTRQLQVRSINLSWSVSYMDVTNPDAQEMGNFSDSANLDLSNDRDLNKTLLNKPYLGEAAPLILKEFVEGVNATSTEAIAFKELVNSLITGK